MGLFLKFFSFPLPLPVDCSRIYEPSLVLITP